MPNKLENNQFSPKSKYLLGYSTQKKQHTNPKKTQNFNATNNYRQPL